MWRSVLHQANGRLTRSKIKNNTTEITNAGKKRIISKTREVDAPLMQIDTKKVIRLSGGILKVYKL